MAHPYEPKDLVLEGFQPIAFSSTLILGIFFLFSFTVLLPLILYLSTPSSFFNEVP